MVEDISGLLHTVFYNLIFFILCLSIFFCFRSLRAKPGTIFSEIDLSPWEAIFKAYSVDDNELAGYIYMEGYLYINFIKNCGYFLLACTLIASLTLIPIYANLKLSSSTELSNLSIKHKQVYDGDLLIPGICTLALTIGTFILAYSYFILPTIHPTLFPTVYLNIGRIISKSCNTIIYRLHWKNSKRNSF